MKVYLEVPYMENGYENFPVMAEDEDIDSEDQVPIRIGTISIAFGVAHETVINAINKHFEI